MCPSQVVYNRNSIIKFRLYTTNWDTVRDTVEGPDKSVLNVLTPEHLKHSQLLTEEVGEKVDVGYTDGVQPGESFDWDSTY